jgi:hypothetical protein
LEINLAGCCFSAGFQSTINNLQSYRRLPWQHALKFTPFPAKRAVVQSCAALALPHTEFVFNTAKELSENLSPRAG